MANERLRAAIHSSGLRVEQVAERLGVDRKSVDRWIDGHRPYRRNQILVGQLLGSDVAYLWPPGTAEQSRDLGQAELVDLWPIRSLVPTSVWTELFASAQQHIDVLVYAGFWLSEDPAVRRVLAERSNAGVSIRFLLGDPASTAVLQRGTEEGIGDAICAKIRNTIHNYRELIATPNTEFRQHATTLYSSIYRADDQMLVNTHLYAQPGHMTPLLHLHRVPGAQLFATYRDSFEQVWARAMPLPVGQQVAS